jgi:hypothetical protein
MRAHPGSTPASRADVADRFTRDDMDSLRRAIERVAKTQAKVNEVSSLSLFPSPSHSWSHSPPLPPPPTVVVCRPSTREVDPANSTWPSNTLGLPGYCVLHGVLTRSLLTEFTMSIAGPEEESTCACGREWGGGTDVTRSRHGGGTGARARAHARPHTRPHARASAGGKSNRQVSKKGRDKVRPLPTFI